MNKNLFFIILFFGVTISWLYAAELKTYEVKAAIYDSKPKFIIAQDGTVSGMGVDIMALIESKSDIKFVYDPKYVLSIRRLEQEIRDGVSDVAFGFNKSAARDSFAVFGEELFDLKIVTVMRKNDTQNFKTLDDLNKLGNEGVILSTSGSAMYKILSDYKINVDDGASSMEANLNKLVSGRGRVIIFSDLVLNYNLKMNPVLANKLKYVNIDYGDRPEFNGAPQYFMFSKKLPKEIMLKIDTVIINAKKSGEWQKILNKYF